MTGLDIGLAPVKVSLLHRAAASQGLRTPSTLKPPSILHQMRLSFHQMGKSSVCERQRFVKVLMFLSAGGMAASM